MKISHGIRLFGSELEALGSLAERTRFSGRPAAQCGDRRGLPTHMSMAKNSLTMGFKAFNQNKTRNFAMNIAGDLSKVTNDVWILRASGLIGIKEKKRPNQTQYQILTDVIVQMANDYGVFPAQNASANLD